MSHLHTIAVVGAGMAGLACAIALAEAGLRVTVFDKGRRPGGRIATRRAGSGTFNHGAQFATARGAGFTALLDGMAARGLVADWPQAGARARVGVPGMSAITGAMGERAVQAGVAMQLDRHVAFLHREGAGWGVRHWPAGEARPGQVSETGGEVAGPFDAVLLALPAPQAVPLLQAAGHGYAARASEAVLAPCWAAMLTFAAPVGGADVLRPESGPIAWAAREASRPGAPGGEGWTVHASPAWSRAHLELPAEEAGGLLAEAFAALTGAGPAGVVAHRWRYALVERALGEACLWDGQAGIGLCGDWCLDRRVEAAFDSGRALAARVSARSVP